MVIFNGYVKLPEGILYIILWWIYHNDICCYMMYSYNGYITNNKIIVVVNDDKMMDIWWVYDGGYPLDPSGKRLYNYGKSPFYSINYVYGHVQ